MSDKTGGSAFPRDAALESKGMTLRDYFAAKALGGFCADPSLLGTKRDDLVSECYEIADAMLQERAK